jgi:glycosyltransferase involved in cell wall biosynthesis
MRYAWDQFDAYFGAERLGRAGSAAARLAMAPLARWDRATAHRVHRYVANSRYVAGRIARYYNRESTVLHPPVDTEFFTPDGVPPGSNFLVVSALVPYKRLDVAIDAATRLGVPLTVAGDGPDLTRLRARSGANVEFVGAVEMDALRELYRRAKAVILPGEEDFGIVPVEAMACGRPVIALGRGGALDTIVDGRTGLLVDTMTADAFAGAMTRLDTMEFDSAATRSHAEQFGIARFERLFAKIVEETMRQPAAC